MTVFSEYKQPLMLATYISEIQTDLKLGLSELAPFENKVSVCFGGWYKTRRRRRRQQKNDQSPRHLGHSLQTNDFSSLPFHPKIRFDPPFPFHPLTTRSYYHLQISISNSLRTASKALLHSPRYPFSYQTNSALILMTVLFMML